jgi:hypothetical protein
MSSSNPMTRDELLENAALDAYGLLDEYEAALYTRSFHHAPAAIQDEILQLQAQLVSDETFLPSDLPDPTLRERVLDAVAVAIEHETAELEPLATIGRGRNAQAEVEAKTISDGPGYYWRAASFALVACVIVALYFWADAAQRHNLVAVLALSNNTEAQLEDLIGPTAKEFIFNPTASRVSFKPAQPATTARAAMYVDEAQGNGLLIIDGLTASQQPIYVLRMIDSNGVRRDVETFGSSGRLSGVKIALNGFTSNLRNASWEIRDASGMILLTSV